MAAPEWAIALEHSGVGTWMRSAELAYPVVNVLHLLGLTLLIGPMLLLDLRLMGFGRRFSLPDVSAVLTPLSIIGILILALSGVLLFSADAGPLIQNRLLLIKLALIAIALINAVVFRLSWQPRLSTWDRQAPLPGRLQAAASITLWLAVGALGRWIAYV